MKWSNLWLSNTSWYILCMQKFFAWVRPNVEEKEYLCANMYEAAAEIWIRAEKDWIAVKIFM